MKKFAIRDDVVAPGIDLAYLCYDETADAYNILIPEGVNPDLQPPIIEYFARSGRKEVGAEWSRKWVEARVTPPERQNIEDILRANGLRKYSEIFFLEKFQGRCCMDDCCLYPMEDE